MQSPEEVPVHHLVVDSCGFFKHCPLHEVGSALYTVPELVSEILDKKTRERIKALPYEIHLKSPSTESIAAVTEAAKKTGDYASLSHVDLLILALSHELHVEHVGKDTINYTIEQKVEQVGTEQLRNEKMVGFVMPKQKTKAAGDEKTAVDDDNNVTEDSKPEKAEEAEDEESEEEEDSWDEDSDDDEEGWLNEDNIDEALKQLGAITIDEKNVKVACMSTDFAVQNVLLHMKLGLVSMDGMRIKRLKTYILRCRACYGTTSVMTKRFCPKCGNDALHRVAVTTNDDGTIQVHINWNRLRSHRGLKFSLPAPDRKGKGGKRIVGPQLFEDQKMPRNRMAKVVQNPLDDNPFTLNDVTSRAAKLGFNTRAAQGQRSNRNPNAYGPSCKKRGGKKR
ncbi:hypothetical protein L596_027074 [Steinernema carpocapsae]|uniref:RNA-binding protein NOB1 n=1 Tax=Steinernema carpocapsae TaxID=34508 RepID=A0A4U5M386_STECR|nr:hypothetical protein L596_027074 [Steinernema carpocapsae]